LGIWSRAPPRRLRLGAIRWRGDWNKRVPADRAGRRRLALLSGAHSGNSRSDPPGSARHQHRDRRFHNNVTRRPAKDHLPDAALGVGALQHQIGAGRQRLLQERLALRFLPAIGGAQADRYAVPLQGARQLFTGRTRLGHVLPPVLLAPGSARAVMAGRHRPDRDAMRIHELAKQAPRLVAPLVPLALQRAVDLRGDREPHLAAEHDRIFRRQAVQPNDVAVEAPGDQQGGLEDRARAAVADHRQEVLHRRLPIPRASITRLGCTRCAIIANPGDSGDRARLDGGGGPDYTPAPSTASNRQMNRSARTFLALFGALCAALALSRAAIAETVNFGTDWKAEAEHGGFYQALAT